MLFLPLLLIHAFTNVQGNPIVLSSPFPVNASLGSTAQFKCICHYCVGQYWQVNNISVTSQAIYNKGVRRLENQIFSNGSKLYTLTMPASVELNGSIIESVVYNGSSVTSLAELLVQGLLSEVSHASVTQINSTVLSLQYTAPYTLTGVPISHYNILILPTNTSVNITDTQYNIHINDHCISYNISITPWNIVGAGNISTLSGIILYQAPVVIMPQLVQIYKANTGTLQVLIEFQSNMSCKGTVPQSISLTVNEDKEYYCSLMSPVTDNCTVTTEDTNNVSVTINITNALEYGAFYSISMSVDNTKTTEFTFNISTYHVITAGISSVNDTTVCLECQFKQNSPSTGCYAVLHPINTTGEVLPLYYKIMKTLHNTIASDCIRTLPNGVYSISILDALSYEEGLFNNTAINIPSLITIHRMTTTSMLVSLMSVSPTTTASFVDSNKSSFSPPFSTNYNYPVTTSSEGSGPPVLTITLSGVAVIVIIIIVIIVIIVVIITAIIVSLCITKRKKKNNKDDDTVHHHTASAINLEYNTTLNEAYDTIDSVTHPNIAYETIKATGRGTTAGGIQANVAYESIRANSVYGVVQEAPTEPTERMYDTINK